MLPLRSARTFCVQPRPTAHPSCGRNDESDDFPIRDDAFLPEVSLHAKLLCDLAVIAMAEGERWVGGDCQYEFPFKLVLGARRLKTNSLTSAGPARTYREAECRSRPGTLPGPR